MLYVRKNSSDNTRKVLKDKQRYWHFQREKELHLVKLSEKLQWQMERIYGTRLYEMAPLSNTNNIYMTVTRNTTTVLQWASNSTPTLSVSHNLVSKNIPLGLVLPTQSVFSSPLTRWLYNFVKFQYLYAQSLDVQTK